MITAQVAINCLDAVAMVKRNMREAKSITVELETLEVLSRIKRHMTREVEEFIVRAALEYNLVMSRTLDGDYLFAKLEWSTPPIPKKKPKPAEFDFNGPNYQPHVVDAMWDAFCKPKAAPKVEHCVKVDVNVHVVV